ncbi:MAG: Na+/H+ antiporter NhaC family protein [Deferribacteraceae bacterium]|jgi:Na+/H+ antiporter NhaC|nr:Na+/H+ antiporter NhaC family protein [Deferribacteraceae bacterium]
MKTQRGIKRVYINRLLFCTFVLTLFALPAFAADSSMAAENSARFGIFTVLPPLVAIALAFITKNVLLSLFFGTFVGCFIIELKTGSFLGVLLALWNGFLRVAMEALASLSDVWNAGIILQVLTIGSLIALVTRLGGVKAIAEWMTKFAKGPRSTQFVAWFMGLFIFFDDYANALIVGPMIRPVTDKMMISRERLSFIVDATAAPIAGIALISTWVAYEIGLIKDALDGIGLGGLSSYSVFVQSIPFRYYNIFILFFVVLTAWMLRDFGPMYKAEFRARTTGQLFRPGSTPMSVDTMAPLDFEKEKDKSSVWYAIIPIGTLIVAAIVGFYVNGYQAIMGGEEEEFIALLQNSPLSWNAVTQAFGESDASVVLFVSAFLASLTAIIIGLIKRKFNIKDALETFLTGIKSMNITAVILLLAWSISGIMKELGTANYLVTNLSGSIPFWSLPAVIFILGSVISFATGTSYGTMGILMPLAVPLAWAINPSHDYLVLSIGSVLTGAIFGDHCSPISDTTILSSMGAACDLMDHVNTQILYSLSIGLIAVITYIVACFGVNIWLVLLIGMAMVVLLVRFIGKPLPLAKKA